MLNSENRESILKNHGKDFAKKKGSLILNQHFALSTIIIKRIDKEDVGMAVLFKVVEF